MDSRKGRERAQLGYVCDGDVAWYPGVRIPNCKVSAYVEHEGGEEKAYILRAL